MHSIPVNLLDLSPEEFKKFLDSFDHVFSDCDGKLHHFLKTYILVLFSTSICVNILLQDSVFDSIDT